MRMREPWTRTRALRLMRIPTQIDSLSCVFFKTLKKLKNTISIFYIWTKSSNHEVIYSIIINLKIRELQLQGLQLVVYFLTNYVHLVVDFKYLFCYFEFYSVDYEFFDLDWLINIFIVSILILKFKYNRLLHILLLWIPIIPFTITFLFAKILLEKQILCEYTYIY